jgi:hypothetical protein
VIKDTSQSTQPMSQLVFHSVVGQLCLTSVLPPEELLREVREELSHIHAGHSPAEVASRLFSRVSSDTGDSWSPQIGHVLWGLPGVRVSSHSGAHYVITSVMWEGLEAPHSVELAPLKSDRLFGRLATAMFPSPDTQVVLQNMVGNIIVIVDEPKDTVRDILMDAVSNPRLRRHSASVAGAVLSALWRDDRVSRSMIIDVGFPEGTPDTLWLRHLSGETYAFSEGVDPTPSEWQIVGKSFLGPHLERQLKTTASRV